MKILEIHCECFTTTHWSREEDLQRFAFAIDKHSVDIFQNEITL